MSHRVGWLRLILELKIGWLNISSSFQFVFYSPNMQTALKRYDLLVIGGGPGGYVAAIKGAQLGMLIVNQVRLRWQQCQLGQQLQHLWNNTKSRAPCCVY